MLSLPLLFQLCIGTAGAAGAGAIEVAGEINCPTAREVEAKLARLLGAEWHERHPSRRHVVRVDSIGDGIRIQMHSKTGELLGERSVPAQGPCEELASAIAVIIAAWEAQLEPAEPPTPPVVRPPEQPWSAEMGLGLGLSLTPGPPSALAAAGALEASMGTRDHGLGGVLALLASTSREVPLGSGHVNWQRFALALGPRYRLTSESPRVDLFAVATLALVSVAGAGYSTNSAALGFDVGAGVGVRTTLSQGPLVPWLKLEGRGWFRRQEAWVTGIEGLALLPNFELQLTAGVAWMPP